jgi:hypothetical protein
MTDIGQAFEALADDPTPEFIAHLEATLQTELVNMPVPPSVAANSDRVAETTYLLDAATKMPRHRVLLSLLAAAATITVAVAIAKPFIHSTSPRVLTETIAPTATQDLTGVKATERSELPSACSAANSEPAADYTVVLDAVALPVSPRYPTALQTGRQDDGVLFAKSGLLFKVGTESEIIVPPEFRDRLSLSWQTARTWDAVVPPCSDYYLRQWVGMPGGYYATGPLCAEVIVRSNGQERRVPIGIGTPCPGQQPAPLEQLPAILPQSTTTTAAPPQSTVVRNVPTGPPTGAETIANWEALEQPPIGPRMAPLVVAIGKEILVVGGVGEQTIRRDGAVFDGSTWRSIPDSPVDLLAHSHSVWTGQYLLAVQNDGKIARFAPSTNRWEIIGATDALGDGGLTASAWTGNEMLISGVWDDPDIRFPISATHDNIAFNPKTGKTRIIPPPPGGGHLGNRSLWTGTEWIVSVTVNGSTSMPLVAYDPSRNQWRELPAGVSGGELILESGQLASYQGFDRAKLIDNVWVPDGSLPAEGNDEFGSAWFIDGHPMVSNGQRETTQRFRYRQSSGAWSDLGTGGFSYGDFVTPVATSDGHLYVFAALPAQLARLRPVVDPTVGIPLCRSDQMQATIENKSFVALRNTSPEACAVDGQRPSNVAFRFGSEWIERPKRASFPTPETESYIAPNAFAVIDFTVYALEPDYNQGCKVYDDASPASGRAFVPADAVRFTLSDGQTIVAEGTIDSKCPDLTVISAA